MKKQQKLIEDEKTDLDINQELEEKKNEKKKKNSKLGAWTTDFGVGMCDYSFFHL